MNKPYKLVAKAIIFHENHVLVLRKSEEERIAKNSHGWDFPGGSLEPDELLLDGLARELAEEIGLTVKVIAPAYVYDEIQEEKHLVIIKFACDQPEGQLILSPEHEYYQWIPLEQLHETEIPEWMKDEIGRAYRIYKEFRTNEEKHL
ncbi:NUDIX hydrolase [Thermoflavimicrobium dichotomicum]|uniref:8-oxo-dGTP diphosphatase n=1 Tax=Thermoflavimicrobium dichotomicum TaxID=46223 RepID=A0A1I3MLU4_9BACL|nr:NUDIX domain-containing protein [Thermoflavimicrobium dichotomicum]SFI97912.1 8-oxo-dGTP diphosphatase [Thermoflavimicrobium dichotomicum]